MKWFGIVVLLLVLVGVGVFVFSQKRETNLDTKEVLQEIVRPTASDVQGISTEKEIPMKQWNAKPKMLLDVKKTYRAVIQTNKGTMMVELFATDVPETVNNFVFLSREKFYDNTIFHRVIKGFMIQGGDPTGTGRGGPGYTFEDEPVVRDYERGTIAMANRGPDTNGSQFFIMHATYGLPKNYTIFGKINPTDAASLKTLDAVAESPVSVSESGENSKPNDKLVIEQIQIEEK